MARYHVNTNTGEVGTCKAAKDGCPFGSAEEHHNDLADAEAARDKYMESQYSKVNTLYKSGAPAGGTDDMPRELKKKIIAGAADGSNRLHPSVVGKVMAKDKDELIRRNVSEKINSQNLARQMSEDESEKVRLNVAKSTKNPAVLKALARDSDSKVRNAALKNERMPKRDAKKVMQQVKDAQAKARKNKQSNTVDLADESNFVKTDWRPQLTDEALSKVRASGKRAPDLPGFDESKPPMPGVDGDYSISKGSPGRVTGEGYNVNYYPDVNDTGISGSKWFKTREEADAFTTGDGPDSLRNTQKTYDPSETERIDRRRERDIKSYQNQPGNYRGD